MILVPCAGIRHRKRYSSINVVHPKLCCNIDAHTLKQSDAEQILILSLIIRFIHAFATCSLES